MEKKKKKKGNEREIKNENKISKTKFNLILLFVKLVFAAFTL